MTAAVSAYTVLKFVHILLAIAAVGANITYGVWTARAARDPQYMSHVLRGIKFLDDRIANPAYGLLLVTGLVLILIGPFELTMFWVVAALVLYVVAIALGLFGYTPALRRQIQTLDARGATSPEFERASSRAQLTGILTSIPVVIIVFLMVTKPGS